MKNNTQAAILNTAEKIITSVGFNAFSYRDIAETVGIRKASIHYYFPTKADLGVALVAKFREKFAAWVESHTITAENVVDVLNDYMSRFADVVQKHSHICLAGMLSAEFESLPVNLQKELKRMMNDQHIFLVNLLIKGREAGQFHARGTPESQAVWLGATLQGGVQIAMTFDNPGLLQSVIEQSRYALLKTTE